MIGTATSLALITTAGAYLIYDKLPKRIKKFDTDGDKKLSQAERDIARATKKAERLGQYDLDKDGSLSQAEKADLIHDKITKRFEHIDKNGDAEISNAEANAVSKPKHNLGCNLASCGQSLHPFDGSICH